MKPADNIDSRSLAGEEGKIQAYLVCTSAVGHGPVQQNSHEVGARGDARHDVAVTMLERRDAGDGMCYARAFVPEDEHRERTLAGSDDAFGTTAQGTQGRVSICAARPLLASRSAAEQSKASDSQRVTNRWEESNTSDDEDAELLVEDQLLRTRINIRVKQRPFEGKNSGVGRSAFRRGLVCWEWAEIERKCGRTRTRTVLKALQTRPIQPAPTQGCMLAAFVLQHRSIYCGVRDSRSSRLSHRLGQ
ncbi:hypothetical protein K438DRAFT_2064713 [Mycena galopus ATCC 62051]|nr:hypothetical protein K438DRAFT_2064713 [Mycena galopus ATCC 62051]